MGTAMDNIFTYVRDGNRVGRIRGLFAPRSKYQECEYFNPVLGVSWRVAAMHLVVISESEYEGLIERDRIAHETVLREKHKAFLVSKGIQFEEQADVLQRLYKKHHRSARCYSCKTHVDNEVDYECSVCLWIVCPHCGACGCGHPSFTPRAPESRDEKQSKKATSGQLLFQTYAQARDYAKRHPGTVLRRGDDQNNWLVSNSES
jgi:hypothetical protein